MDSNVMQTRPLQRQRRFVTLQELACVLNKRFLTVVYQEAAAITMTSLSGLPPNTLHPTPS